MPFARFEPDSDEEAFIAKCKDDYFDDTARLVFADFLQDRGDPRGEYIRYQVQLSKLDFEEEKQYRRTRNRSLDFYNQTNDLRYKIGDLYMRYGGQWFGSLWRGGCNSGHSFDRGLMTVDVSPSNLNMPMIQRSLPWADTIRVSHSEGGMTALEKGLEGNQICRINFSNSYTQMMITMRLRFLRWLHRRSKRLPPRVVCLDFGNGVSQEQFDLIATLPDHVLGQIKRIHAEAGWNENTLADDCRTHLSGRWDGALVG